MQAVKCLVKFTTALLNTDAFLWQLFPDGLQSDFQFINHLRLRLEFMLFFDHGAPFFSINPGQFACSQFCKIGGCLGLNNIA